MRLIISCLTIFIWASSSFLNAQLNSGGMPVSYNQAIFNNIKAIDIPINFSEIYFLSKQESKHNKNIEYFAINHEVFITPLSHGSWQHLNGLNIWIIQIKAEQAKSLALVFENLQLKVGEKLYVYNKNDVLGAFTIQNIPKSKVLSTLPIAGSNIIVEFSTPYNKRSCGTFTITTLSYGLKEQLNDEDPCNVNISCTEGAGWNEVKRSVAKLVVNRYNGTILCSGTLLNNTQNNARPLLITANHCIENDFNAERTNFIFNFESPSCSSNYSLQVHSLAGSKLLSSKYENDFSLVELDAHPPISFRPYYAGWSIDTGVTMNQVVAIHHPNGKVKKITGTNSHPTTDTYFEPGEPSYAFNAFWLVREYDYGITENGSSGCGLFDLNRQLIGTLTGGNSSDLNTCSRDLYDYYQKFSFSYKVSPNYGSPMIQFLNPDTLPISNLQGYDPFPNPYSGCDTNYNISSAEISESVLFDYGQGYYAGHNAEQIDQFAEKFVNNDSIYLYGVEFYIHHAGNTGGFTLQIYQGDDVPQTLIDERFVSLSRLIPFSTNYIEFYPFIRIKGNYFVVIKLYYDSDTVNFAVVKRIAEPFNTSFLWINNSWVPFNDYTQGNWNASIDIKTMYCTSFVNDSKQVPTTPVVEIFPNPSMGYFYLKTQNEHIKEFYIYNLDGKQININLEKRNDIYPINLMSYPSGVYMVKIITEKRNILFYKLVKI